MAIEAALVVPVLMVLVFGMIEMAFAVRDYASLTSLSRAGARVASTAAAAGPASNTVCSDTDATLPTCAPAQVPAMAQLAADAVQRAGTAMDPDQIQFMLVYRANSAGFPGAETNRTMPTTCAGLTACVRFTWQPTRNQFRYHSGSWASTTISACFPGSAETPLERVGVFVNADHRFLTGLFGATLNLGDHTMMNFEPLPTGSCNGNGVAAGGHQ